MAFGMEMGGELSSSVPSLRSDQTFWKSYNDASGGDNTESYTVPAGKVLYVTSAEYMTQGADKYMQLLNDAGTIMLHDEDVNDGTWIFNFPSPIRVESGDTFDFRISGSGRGTCVGWTEGA